VSCFLPMLLSNRQKASVFSSSESSSSLCANIFSLKDLLHVGLCLLISLTVKICFISEVVLIHSFVHRWSYSPLLGPGLFFSFVIFFYTDGRIPLTSDQPVGRPLPTRRTTQSQNKRTHRHSCLEWGWNPRSELSSELRQFMP
jgi:hypothetical protein